MSESSHHLIVSATDNTAGVFAKIGQNAKKMSGEVEGGMFKNLNRQFGEGSELGQFLKLAKGGGAIAAVTYATSQATAGMNEWAEAVNKVSRGEMTAEESHYRVALSLTKSIPVMGQFVALGESIGNVIASYKDAPLLRMAEAAKAARKEWGEWAAATERFNAAAERFDKRFYSGGLTGGDAIRQGAYDKFGEDRAAIAKMRDDLSKAGPNTNIRKAMAEIERATIAAEADLQRALLDADEADTARAKKHEDEKFNLIGESARRRRELEVKLTKDAGDDIEAEYEAKIAALKDGSEKLAAEARMAKDREMAIRGMSGAKPEEIESASLAATQAARLARIAAEDNAKEIALLESTRAREAAAARSEQFQAEVAPWFALKERARMMAKDMLTREDQFRPTLAAPLVTSRFITGVQSTGQSRVEAGTDRIVKATERAEKLLDGLVSLNEQMVDNFRRATAAGALILSQ